MTVTDEDMSDIERATVDIAAHRIAAAQAERDAVVKWLRGDLNAEMVEAISFQISLALQETGYVGAKYSLRIAGDIAQAIEAGEHLTPPSA